MGCAVGGMSGWDHGALLCQHQVGQALLPGGILEFLVESFLGDLSLDREEQCQVLAVVSRDVWPSTILCCLLLGKSEQQAN